MNKSRYIVSSVLLGLLFLLGCSGPEISKKSNLSQLDDNVSLALYPLANYTDTPRAGLRASNIIEGVLLSQGYRVSSYVDEENDALTLSDKLEEAKQHHIAYLFLGGISEWRYKTGIDGEPAISLHLKCIDVKTKKIVWSAIGANNSWGNASIGTVAQELIMSMIDKNIAK